jgi:hypothetical protein
MSTSPAILTPTARGYDPRQMRDLPRAKPKGECFGRFSLTRRQGVHIIRHMTVATANRDGSYSTVFPTLHTTSESTSTVSSTGIDSRTIGG